MTWAILPQPAAARMHVVPCDDLRGHELCPQCWCRPRDDEEVGDAVMVHNSMDGREAFERGERQPS